MSELEIVDLYQNADEEKNKNFVDSIDSNLHITTQLDQATTDFEWLEIMEETVRYLDNIYRNPNRFIVNEEEIVNVEKARKVTVETIKHLSRHTNFIQEISDKGEVRPSKILNINKDEQAKNNLIEMIKLKGLTCSNLFMTPLMFLFLKNNHQEQLLNQLILDKDGWLNMIKEGATTTFEAFYKDKKWNTSLLHTMFSFVILFMN